MQDCRTCLEQVIVRNCVNIEAQVRNNMDVLQAIQEVTSLQGSHDDLLPKFICKKCFKLLRSTIAFRRLIINSYSQLMSKTYSDSDNSHLSVENNLTSTNCLEFLSNNNNEHKMKTQDSTSKSSEVKYDGNGGNSENVMVLSSETGVACIMDNFLNLDENIHKHQVLSDSLNEADKGNIEKYSGKIKRKINTECENTISKSHPTRENGNHNFCVLPELLPKRRRKWKEMDKLELDSVVKSTETVVTESKQVVKTKGEECILKKLSDFSLQKIDEDIKEMVSVNMHTKKVIKSDSTSKKSLSYTCTLCGTMLKGKKKYNMHMKIHNNEGPPLLYVCSICPKSYAKKEYLLVHMRSHTGEKPYHCDICDKNFSQFATYYVHKRRLHDKVVQGTCSYCGKMFVDKPELDVHIKMWHTGERPYLCEFCSATFVCNRTLQRHRKEIHSEKKPCQKCGKMLGDYALKKHLVRHQVLEEGLKIVRKKYTCEYCKTVMNFTSRRRHLEKQHGIKLHGRGDDCTKVPIDETSDKIEATSPKIS